MPTSVPPPPPMFSGIPPPNDEEAFSNMLLSWYMCGYHTGYCQVIVIKAAIPSKIFFYFISNQLLFLFLQAIQNERKKKMDTCKDLPPS